MQAIVKIGKSQFLVSPGLEILIDKVDKTEGSLNLDQVLMIIDGPNTQVGQPIVSGFTVSAQILGPEKGDKIRSAVYTAKSRHRRVTGFRPQFTRIRIEDIRSAEAKPAASKVLPKTRTRKPVKSAS